MSNVRTIKSVPTPADLARVHPLSDEGRRQVEADRQEIRAILAGEDRRLLVIVGPCSAWPSEAVLEYAARLRDLSGELQDDLKLVLRVYIQKPRTTRGWTGPVNQPDPFSPPDVEAGMHYARRLMVSAVELGLPIADEALFTHNARGFVELLSWVAIGARSSEDQEHRIWASSLDAPVGIKNPTSGSIQVGVNGVLAAQHPHTAVFDRQQVETAGNPYAHLVLRGGSGGPNHALADLLHAQRLLVAKGLRNPSVLVDASHDNCRRRGQKDPRWQAEVLRSVLQDVRDHPKVRGAVKGFLCESFLQTGCQALGDHSCETIDRNGLSVTDPCLGWDATAALLRETAVAVARLRGTLSGRLSA